MLDDDGHLLTVGCPGSGKSMSVIWPNLAHFIGNVIVLDPKGEHAAETYWRRNRPELAGEHAKRTKCTLGGCGDKGTDTVCFKLDPFNEVPDIPNAHYNPLSEIDLSDTKNSRARLGAIAEACVLSEGDKNRYFTEGAKKILVGVMAHVLSEYPPEYHNLPAVYDLIVEYDPDIGVADPDMLDRLIDDMRCNPVAGGVCNMAASILGNRSGDSFKSMIQTVRNSINWMGDECMREHLSQGSDFSFNDFREKVPGTGGYRTLYIVAPIGMKLEEQMRWLRVLTNLGIEVMRNRKKFDGSTLVILDEFAQLGSSLSSVTKGLVTLRERKIKLWPFLQNIGQLEAQFGRETGNFLETSSVQVFGVEGADARSTAEWVSRRLGRYYHKQDFDGRDARLLLTPQEVEEELGKSKASQVVFHHGISFPLRLRRRAYARIRKKPGDTFKRKPDMAGCFELRWKDRNKN